MSKPNDKQNQSEKGSNPGQGGSQGNKHYNFTIDRAPFKHDKPTIMGSGIRTLGNIPSADGIWQKAHASEPDKEIADSDEVNLSEQSTEHFFSGPKTTTEG